MKNRHTILIAAAVFCGMIMFSAATPAQQDGFKNLQVLPKNISAKELDRIMESFNEGLGVSCDYCHAKGKTDGSLNFETDTKAEKIMTRKMMIMTNELNQKYFPSTSNAQAVTCYTCHHGNPMPATDTADFRRKAEY